MADIDWKLIGVASAEGDDEIIDPFIYTFGLWDRHQLPELWCSTTGTCGHNTELEGLGMVMNQLAGRLVDEGKLDEPVPVPFQSRLSDGPIVLTFTPEPPSTKKRNDLQTFVTKRQAPIIEIRWRCCDGA